LSDPGAAAAAPDEAVDAARLPGRRPGGQVIPRPVNLRLGGAPPWAALPPEARRPSVADVRAALARAATPRPSVLEGTGTRPSAVLAALYDDADGLATVVLTRRSAHLRSHRGEVSFPGGGREPGDADLRATALREAHEEVDLEPAAVELIGELDHLQTVTSRSYIVPFVGALADRPELRASPDEVEAIRYVTLAELLDPAIYRQERWGLPPLEHPISFFELDGDTVWGATAGMLRNLLEVVTGTRAGTEPDNF
jgi:8-oxo-dGTP pyrophosphatase MutT (NUDIX family)